MTDGDYRHLEAMLGFVAFVTTLVVVAVSIAGWTRVRAEAEVEVACVSAGGTYIDDACVRVCE